MLLPLSLVGIPIENSMHAGYVCCGVLEEKKLKKKINKINSIAKRNVTTVARVFKG